MAEENKVYVTRRGRVVRQPVRYEPDEVCGDDYNDTDYESESDAPDCVSIATSDEEDSDEYTDSDEDEAGNLKGFVVDSDSESESESDCD